MSSCDHPLHNSESLAFASSVFEDAAFQLSAHLQQLLEHPEAVEIIQREPTRLRRVYLEFATENMADVDAILTEAGMDTKSLKLIMPSEEGHSGLSCVLTAPTHQIIEFLKQPVKLASARIDFPEFTWLSNLYHQAFNQRIS